MVCQLSFTPFSLYYITNLIDSFDFSFHNGKLSADQRRGIINLIPKQDKDPSILKNWRPISILNTDYKLLTKYIANRLKISFTVTNLAFFLEDTLGRMFFLL